MFKIEKKNKEPFFEKKVYPADIKEFYVVAATKDDNTEVYMTIDFSSGGYITWTSYIDAAARFYSLNNLKKFHNCSFNSSLHYASVKDPYYKLITIVTETESLKGEPLEYQED